MSKKKIVLKIGGSLLYDEQLNIRKKIIDQFSELVKKSEIIGAIVVGGGLVARKFINIARYFNANESICDTFGIETSRLNARLLITALGEKCFPEPIKNLEDVRKYQLWDRILISGGFIPGQSTTSVTFEIAESLGATDILILTNVDGIFDKDPKKNSDAKKFDDISIQKLEQVIYGEGGDSQSSAGEYRIFDAVSLQILKRNNFNVRIANGEKYSVLKKILIEKASDNGIGTKILKR